MTVIAFRLGGYSIALPGIERRSIRIPRFVNRPGLAKERGYPDLAVFTHRATQLNPDTQQRKENPHESA